MSIEFRINQYDEERCYSNGAIDLKSFLTALYSDEHPYGALLNLDGNKRIEPADYAYDEQSGKETYDIDFDRDTITRHEKGKQFKLNEMSKIPLGAAYSLLRFHGAGVPAAVSDCEYDEYNDMSGLFGNRDSEIKDRGFVIYSNDEYFDTVHAEISYYIIGQSGVESERLPDEFGCDIVSHLDAAVQYADLLEERSLNIDFSDYEMSF